MNYHLLSLPLLAAGFLVGCDSGQESSGVPAEPKEQKVATATLAPAAPSAEVRTALEAQPIGKNLLGNTVGLVGDSFQPVDPAVAPEAYFVYYSASW